MNYRRLITFVTFGAILLTGCTDKIKEMQEKANVQFGDQHFKTSISLIELYKVRHGHYPPVLDSLEYTGDWDQMAISSVDYKLLNEGYELNLVTGWIGKPDSLAYPSGFWNGLGYQKIKSDGSRIRCQY